MPAATDRYERPLSYRGVTFLDVPEEAHVGIVRAFVSNPASPGNAAPVVSTDLIGVGSTFLWLPSRALAFVNRPFQGRILAAAGAVHAPETVRVAQFFDWRIDRYEIPADDAEASAINPAALDFDLQSLSSLGLTTGRPCRHGPLDVLAPAIFPAAHARFSDAHAFRGNIEHRIASGIVVDTYTCEIAMVLALWESDEP